MLGDLADKARDAAKDPIMDNIFPLKDYPAPHANSAKAKGQFATRNDWWECLSIRSFTFWICNRL